MGIARGPDVITKDLVLALDAADDRSYPGSGTSWTNLVDESSKGTLTNGATFSTDDFGTIVFDGTDDLVTQPYDMSNMSEFSIEFWAKTYNTGSTGGDNNAALAGPNSGGTYIRTGFSKSNERLSILFYVDGAEDQKSMSTNINYSDFNPLGHNHYMLTIKDQDSMNIYFNGELKATESTGAMMTTGMDNYYQRIGNYASAFLWTGDIPVCRLYSRILTANEIKQNYLALKNRFGL